MKVENEMALPITKSVTVMLLEPYAGKLARTVLRGESSRKGADLLDFLSVLNYFFIPQKQHGIKQFPFFQKGQAVLSRLFHPLFYSRFLLK